MCYCEPYIYSPRKRLCFDKNPKAICTIYSSIMMKSLEMTSKFCCIFIFKEQKMA